MSARPVQSPAARPAAPSQQATLDALVAAACTQVKEQLPAMGERLAGALADVSQPGLEAKEVYRRVKSGKLLKENGYAFVHLAIDLIGEALRRELERLVPSAPAARVAPDALTLVPLEEMDDKLAFAALARPFDIAHSEALAMLGVRLGMLLGRGVLRADGNPFRPDVFLQAIDAAWRAFEPDADAHGLIQGLLRPELLFDFAPVYDAVGTALARKEGQPGSVESYRIQKTDDSAAAKAARAASRAALAEQLRKLFGDDGGEDGVPLIPDLPGLPAGNGGWRPSAASGFAQAPAPAVPQAAADGASPGGPVPGVAGAVAAPPMPAAVQAAAHAGVQVGVQAGVQASNTASPNGAGAASAPLGGAQPAAGFVSVPAGNVQPAGGFANLPAGAAQTASQFVAAPVDGAPRASGVGSGPAATAQSPAGAMTGPLGALHAAAGSVPGLVPGLMHGLTPASGDAVHATPGFAHAHAGMAAAVLGPGLAAGPVALQAVLAGVQPGVVAPLLDLLARIEPALASAGAQPGLADTAGSIVASAGAEGAGATVPHDVFYLPRLRQSLPRGSLSRGDERTLDLLSRVFETVLLDASIPPQTRDLLQLLQVPVLKAALVDKNFFFEEAHPARRLVDLLSRMGWEQRQDADDPMVQAMRRSVAHVENGVSAEGFAADGFAAAVAELEASLAAEDSALDAALAAPVASAVKHERMAVATRAARDAVALRIRAGIGADAAAGDLVEVVSGFLEQRWTTVMTFAYSIEAQKPGAVGNAMRAMDDLIWSVKPKPTHEQRKALIARLPRLLGTLNKWLDAIKWQDADRLQFFARLAEYHASIVRAPIELSPERQLELAVEAAQQDALRRVELENAAAERAEVEQQALSPLDGLERGMWLEFRNADGARKVKLAWVSPLRTLFIFSGAARREAFSLPAEKLVEALHDGSARVLAIDGVVGQVLAEAMGQGAMNDASLLAAASRAAAA